MKQNYSNRKKCNKCGEEKSLTLEFNRCAKNKDGYQNHCRECQVGVRRAYYLKHREREIEVQKTYRTMYANKSKAESLSRKYASIRPEGCEYHHWSYFDLDRVIILSKAMHKRVHDRLTFDDVEQHFIVTETREVLDTFEKHFEFVKSVALLFRDGVTFGHINFSEL